MNLAKSTLMLSLLILSSCGLPTNKLTPKERQSDMNWAFTVFRHNYAPAELKEKSFGVNLDQLEADCVAKAATDMDNQVFLSLFQKCIHAFKDAHVGAQQMNNGLLPEYAQVAHLGFVTMRTKVRQLDETGRFVFKDALKIMGLLNGSDTPTAPLIVGDIITEVDGIAVRDHINSEIIPYINVGQDETNLSIAAFRFAVRTSFDMALPLEDELTLTIVRGANTFSITLPWIKEDMLAFQIKQNPSPEEGEEKLPAEVEEALEKYRGVGPSLAHKMKQNPLGQAFLGFHEIKSLFDFLANPVSMVTDRVKLIALRGFHWAKFNPILSSLFKGELDKEGFAKALNTKSFPMAAGVKDLMANPLFTAKIISTNSSETYAYIQLPNFPAEDKILTEWFRAMTAIEDKGIKSLIIDTVDNTGGSLVHGMRMLNMLRKGQTLKYPSLQAKLNNNWINAFRTQAAFGADDYQKTVGARMVRDFEADQAAGLALSRPFPVTVLDPFFLQNPEYGVSSDVKIALLVNEFCVSMCDIFASVFQDNNMGVIVGQRTMGGGGNVTQHGLSPISKIGISVTESLVLSPNGKMIEDKGVIPDIKVDMVMDRENGFAEALGEALKVILIAAPTPSPTPAGL